MPEDPEAQESSTEQSAEEQGGARPFWSGTISFGLVSVPVQLYSANRRARMSLRMLGPEGVPLSRRYFSAVKDRELPNNQLSRGFEVTEGNYVIVTDDELDQLAPEKTRDIALKKFVDAAAIAPVYFDKSYYLTPAGDSNRAYRLLAATMEETSRAGIATFVMRGKEYLIAIFAENGILAAETLRFAEEIRSPDDVGLPSPIEPGPDSVERFARFIRGHAADALDEAELRDESLERLRHLIESKRKKKQTIVHGEPGDAGQREAIDILDVLKRSLSQANQEAAAARKPPASERKSAARKSKS